MSKSGIPEFLKRGALLLASVISVFYLTECVFMFLPVSQGINLAYCSKIWFQKYWRLNDQRYRDREYDNNDFDPRRKKIFFIGDSYTAGHGIKNPADRVSDLVAEKLGPQYVVFNFGQNGSDTKDELRRLLEVPFKPHIVVWQHCMNDIEYLGNSKAQLYKRMTTSPSMCFRLFSWMSSYSFALNYAFWNYQSFKQSMETIKNSDEEAAFFHSNPHPFQALRVKFYNMESVRQRLSGSEIALYLDTISYNRHIADLVSVDSICKRNNIKMIMLFYPYSDDRSLHQMKDDMVRSLEESVEQHGVKTLDVFSSATEITENERVVGHLDPHPGVAWNRLVAIDLLKKINAEGW
ncbi:MAG: SGNH/GDSL hydrolase family protein [Chitinophagales bacterium]